MLIIYMFFVFSGIACDTLIDYCRSSPCQHKGKCHSFMEGYVCKCRSGYGGHDCETGRWMLYCIEELKLRSLVFALKNIYM